MKFRFVALTLLLTAACGRSYGAKEGATPPSEPVDLQAILGPGESPADAMISDRVRDAILANSLLRKDSGSVQVSTKDGVVTLSGTVSSQANKQSMEAVVNSVGSVSGVRNQLTIDPHPRTRGVMESTLDHAISDRVRHAILMDSGTAAEAAYVRVVTQGGVVTISGTVKTPAAKQRMSTVASAVGSVVSVDNQIAIRP